MEGEPHGQCALVVRVVGWTAIGSPKVEVLIDGRPVGVLSDLRARSLPLGAGAHRVATRVGFLRSRSLVLSLAPGERASLECGFHRWQLALPIAFLALNGAGLLLMNLGQQGKAMAVQGLALSVLVAELLTPIALPGARLYLRRSAVPLDAGELPERMAPPSPDARPERGRRGFQFGLKGLLIVVACCAPLFWVARELWDRRPANQPARAFRMLRSGDSAARRSGARDVHSLLLLNSLTPEQVDDAIPDLLAALHDQNPDVREVAAGCLFTIVFEATRRSAAVPRVQDVAAGLAGGLHDTLPIVRHHTGLALANIYFLPSGSGKTQPALPVDVDRFLDSLGVAFEGPDREMRDQAFWVLQSIAPRLDRAVPPRLLAALDAGDAVTRARAIDLIVKFPRGLDSAVPALLRALEHDADPDVRKRCSWALVGVRPSPDSIPLLREALRSPERPVRFRAADLLSHLGPRASEAVPAVLPLLEETFEPVTSFEREHPEWADPAVAASWALGAIAPGTELADTARASLEECLRRPGHPWRRRDAEWALGRLDPASAREPGNARAGAPSQ